jgi:hypothetical protein
VLKYLARYTHRVAISNGRLLSLDNGQVRFRWRDSRHGNRSSVMSQLLFPSRPANRVGAPQKLSNHHKATALAA